MATKQQPNVTTKRQSATVSFDREVWLKAHALAKQEGVGFREVVNNALVQYLRKAVCTLDWRPM